MVRTFAILAASVGLLVALMQLWRADLDVPLSYVGGDVLLSASWVQGVRENGTILHNPRLGTPFAAEHTDYPIPDVWHLTCLQVLGWCCPGRSAFFVANVYYLLTYPLTVLTALVALRTFGLSFGAAGMASILYAFLPYHYLRFQGGHYFLACYYLVPLSLIPAGWLVLGVDWPRWRWGLAGVIAVVSAWGGLYYACFAAFFLLVAGLLHGEWRSIGRGVLLAGAVFAALLVAVAPNLLHQCREGVNVDAVQRSPGESEYHGLKLGQMLLPVPGHRYCSFRALREEYDKAPQRPAQAENCTAALGVIGSIGAIVLLLGAFRRVRSEEWGVGRETIKGHGLDSSLRTPHSALARLFLAGFLLATVGGACGVVGVLVTDKIRAYNRISVFLAFLALWAVAALVERIPVRSRGWRCLMLSGLTVLGVIDQTNRHFEPSYRLNTQAFQADAEFVQTVESVLPVGGRVLQLPAFRYPEDVPPHGVHCYEHLRGYLHSQKLCWSFGTLKGRRADEWRRALVTQSTERMLHDAVVADFVALWIDRWALAKTSTLEMELAALVPDLPLASADSRWVVYPLAQYAATQTITPGERAALFGRPHVEWHTGFGAREGSDVLPWHWAGPKATFSLVNPTNEPQRVRLTLFVQNEQAEPTRVRFAGWLTAETWAREQSTPVMIEADLPPGRHPITVTARVPKRFEPKHLGRPAVGIGLAELRVCERD